MDNKVDLVNSKFGRWSVESFGVFHNRHPKWNCRCDCGNKSMVFEFALRNGRSVSCGCFAREQSSSRNRTHGNSMGYKVTPEYRVWSGMKTRCLNPSHEFYCDYGGRGITICTEWVTDFNQFLRDMGPRPSLKYTLDRIDHNGNYTKANCRWATKQEQMRNMRSNKLITFEGKTHTQVEWSEITGLSQGCISQRLGKGWSVDDTITTPPTIRRKRLMP